MEGKYFTHAGPPTKSNWIGSMMNPYLENISKPSYDSANGPSQVSLLFSLCSSLCSSHTGLLCCLLNRSNTLPSQGFSSSCSPSFYIFLLYALIVCCLFPYDNTYSQGQRHLFILFIDIAQALRMMLGT